MNQSNFSVKSFCKQLLVSFLLSFTAFLLLIILLSYLLFQIPHYESYLSYFPWVATFLGAVIISLICRSHGKQAMMASFIVSGVISLICLMIGLILSKGDLKLPILLARFVIFISASVFFEIPLLRKKKQRRSKPEKFRFSK